MCYSKPATLPPFIKYYQMNTEKNIPFQAINWTEIPKIEHRRFELTPFNNSKWCKSDDN
jgi:hypothetical protein